MPASGTIARARTTSCELSGIARSAAGDPCARRLGSPRATAASPQPITTATATRPGTSPSPRVRAASTGSAVPMAS
ncbi:hypothetical protein ACFQX8_21445 [Klenkia terrae]|uniref:hypothetical protein n=1 Tax=Klenkia terrae TaxID=1052259 RepID=UPI00360A210C